MHADFDLAPDGSLTPSRGGRREGAGRKPGYSPKNAEALDQLSDADLSDLPDDSTTTAIKKARAIARKEEALANQAELKYKIDSKEYLSRSAFREASATLLAELAQLRSIPDVLERRFALAPEVVQDMEQTIDEALATVAAGLALFTEVSE